MFTPALLNAAEPNPAASNQLVLFMQTKQLHTLERSGLDHCQVDSGAVHYLYQSQEAEYLHVIPCVGNWKRPQSDGRQGTKCSEDERSEIMC